MNFIKANKDKIVELEINLDIDNYTDIYFLKDDNILIGYGIINKSLKENILYIHIYKEYRGNGYGRKLFEYLCNELKKDGIKELLFTIDKSNIRFISIINKYNNLHLGTNNNSVKYVVQII